MSQSPQSGTTSETEASRQPVCDVPALCYHAAFWPNTDDDPQDAEDDEEYKKKFIAWMGQVNKTLIFIQSVEPRPSNFKYKEFEITYDTKKYSSGGDRFQNRKLPFIKNTIKEFELKWRGLTIFCLAEAAIDYIGISFYFDRNKQGQSGDLFNQISNALNIAQTQTQTPAPTDEQYKLAVDFLYGNFWLQFAEAISRYPGTEKPEDIFPGEVFAAQYGLALKCKTSDLADPKTFLTNNKFAEALNAKSEKRDLTASLAYNKRAIFVAAVGTRERGSELRPSKWVIYADDTTNALESGRRLADINTMATLRMVATKEYELFRKMGTSLRIHGHSIDNASDDFNKILERHDKMDFEDLYLASFDLKEFAGGLVDPAIGSNSSKFVRLTKDTRDLQSRLCKIEAKLYDESSDFTGGLQFRVSRSRLYASRFRLYLNGLNFEPIPGYQSFNIYIQRHFNQILEYISDIGTRADGLRKRLSGLLDAIQSKTMIDLTKNIEVLNTAISTQSRAGRRRTALLFFITVFATISQILLPVFQNQLERGRSEFLGTAAVAVERISDDAEAWLARKADAFIWRYVVDDVSQLKAVAKEKNPVVPDGKINYAPRAATLAYLSAFLIALTINFLGFIYNVSDWIGGKAWGILIYPLAPFLWVIRLPFVVIGWLVKSLFSGLVWIIKWPFLKVWTLTGMDVVADKLRNLSWKSFLPWTSA